MRHVNRALGHPGLSTSRAAQVTNDDYILGVANERLLPAILPDGSRDRVNGLRAPLSGILWIVLGPIYRPPFDGEIMSGRKVHWITSAGCCGFRSRGRERISMRSS